MWEHWYVFSHATCPAAAVQAERLLRKLACSDRHGEQTERQSDRATKRQSDKATEREPQTERFQTLEVFDRKTCMDMGESALPSGLASSIARRRVAIAVLAPPAKVRPPRPPLVPAQAAALLLRLLLLPLLAVAGGSVKCAIFVQNLERPLDAPAELLSEQ